MARRYHPRNVSTDGYLCVKFLLEYQRKHRLPKDRYQPGLIEDFLLSYTKCKQGAGAAASHRKLGEALGEVAHFCLDNEIPPLNALVINAGKKRPGGRYLGTDRGGQWERDVYAALTFDYPPKLLAYVIERG